MQEKITALFDERSFTQLLENVQEGVITGYGQIESSLVFVVSSDKESMGGSISIGHANKVIRLLDKARAASAPVIFLLDSSGVRLEESAQSAQGLGMLINAIAQFKGNAPLISIVCGNVGGAFSTICSLCDFNFMLNDAALYINAPLSVKDSKEDTSDSKFQASAGYVDYAGSFSDITAKIRGLIPHIPLSYADSRVMNDIADDYNRAVDIEGEELNIASIFSKISDEGYTFSYRDGFSPNVHCAIISLGGISVAAIGAGGSDEGTYLSGQDVEKATDFAILADQLDMPVLLYLNYDGYERTIHSEVCLRRRLSRFAKVISQTEVPVVTVYGKQAVGSFQVFAGNAIGADITYALEDSNISLLEAEEIKKITGIKESNSLEDMLKCGYLDGVIPKSQLRKYLISAFEMLYTA